MLLKIQRLCQIPHWPVCKVEMGNFHYWSLRVESAVLKISKLLKGRLCVNARHQLWRFSDRVIYKPSEFLLETCSSVILVQKFVTFIKCQLAISESLILYSWKYFLSFAHNFSKCLASRESGWDRIYPTCAAETLKLFSLCK